MAQHTRKSSEASFRNLLITHSTGRGVAYCDDTAAKSGTSGLQLVTEWPGLSSNAANEKVPSRVSYDPDGAVKYGNEIRHNHKFDVHSCMKLKLDQNTTDLARELEDLHFGANGHSRHDVVALCASYLSRLRADAEESMRQRYGSKTYGSVRKELVVTVPAVWSERAKDLTMKALERSGWQPDKSTLVTEPEAAAMFTLKQMMEGPSRSEFDVGNTFIICDAGGGTVDSISYTIKQKSPLRIQEATVGSGDKCGATFLDKAFLDWLKLWIGPHRFNKIPYAKSRPGSPLLNSFETNKYAFDGKENDWTVTLPSDCGVETDETLNVEDRVLTMTTAQMKEIFEPTMKQILDIIYGQIKSIKAVGLEKPKLVLVVGGFGRNPYLYEQIRSHCARQDIGTRRPQGEWSAVVKGAVCCGLEGIESLEKRLIVSRRARKFYGLSRHSTWDSSKHHPDDYFIDAVDGKPYARSQMQWLMAKGDELPTAMPKIIRMSVYGTFKFNEAPYCRGILWGYDGDKAPARRAAGGIC